MKSFIVNYLIGKKSNKKIVFAESELSARETLYIELTDKQVSDFQITEVKQKGK